MQATLQNRSDSGSTQPSFTVKNGEPTFFGRPLIILLFGAALFAFGGFGTYMFGSEMLESSRCSAVTTGRLSNQYTEIKHQENGVTTNSEYNVTYHFTVDGVEYHGEDTLQNEPTSVNISVRYNPADPSKNELVAKSEWVILFTIAFMAAGVYLAVFLKPGV